MAGSPAVGVDAPDLSGSPDFDEAGFELRSFFAQPDPLNTIVGAESALRNGAPQTGQFAGPLSFTPWITSVV